MKNLYPISALFALLFTVNANAQTCGGEIVKFQETFGAGATKAPLAAGRTNYNYNGTSALADGDYVLSNSSQAKPEWHISPDHTGDLNGRMMVTNASYTPGEFYRDTVYGVSSVSTYNIYFYAMNVNTVGTCSPNPILPRLQLIVESYNFDGTFTEIYSLISSALPQTTNPTWVKISGQFYLPTACTAVRYRIINNSTGGCGNDLAIDDITFSQCNPTLLAIREPGLKRERTNSGSKSSSIQTTELKTYPNPFTTTLNIDFESDRMQPVSVRVFDMNGKIIHSAPWNLRNGANSKSLSGLDNYASGMYFINIVDANGMVISKGKALKK